MFGISNKNYVGITIIGALNVTVGIIVFYKVKMSFQPVKSSVRKVKPLLSTDYDEARRRVIRLYKAFYRQIPKTIFGYHLPITTEMARQKLREEFLKHKDVKDIRVIDMLVIKGQMNLKETSMIWKQSCQIMYQFRDSVPQKSQNFLSKFLKD